MLDDIPLTQEQVKSVGRTVDLAKRKITLPRGPRAIAGKSRTQNELGFLRNAGVRASQAANLTAEIPLALAGLAQAGRRLALGKLAKNKKTRAIMEAVREGNKYRNPFSSYIGRRMFIGGPDETYEDLHQNYAMGPLAKTLTINRYGKWRKTGDVHYSSEIAETVKNFLPFCQSTYALTSGERQEVRGWEYLWFMERERPVAYFAYRFDSVKDNYAVVFGFRGSVDTIDFIQDGASEAWQSLSEFGDLKPAYRIEGGSGFISKFRTIGNAGLSDIICYGAHRFIQNDERVYCTSDVMDYDDDDSFTKGIESKYPKLRDIFSKGISFVGITGHSLGGAEADICAALLTQYWWPLITKMTLVTFEPARGLMKSTITTLKENIPYFREFEDGNAYFITNPFDPVPTVPTNPPYAHLGVNIMLTDENMEKEKPNAGSHSSDYVFDLIRNYGSDLGSTTSMFTTDGKGKIKRKRKSR